MRNRNREIGPRRHRRGRRPTSRRSTHARWSAEAVATLALLVVATTLAWLLLPVQAPVQARYVVGFPPPPQSGYFSTLPPGSWSRLPGDDICSQQVHASTWEPRPDNYEPNHTMPPSGASACLLGVPARDRSYAAKWCTSLLPRVTGAHVGTTDANIQWAACKWGDVRQPATSHRCPRVDMDPLRHLPVGSLRPEHGLRGHDHAAHPREPKILRALFSQAGHNYQRDYGRGRCPATFSIVGVKSWQNPAWGRMPHNQNGTFPFNRDSTAFALDYLGSFLRGCYEGWLPWLDNTGNRRYATGDQWGCVGAWYAGAWRSPSARRYIRLVQGDLRNRAWLKPAFAYEAPPCSARFWLSAFPSDPGSCPS